MKSEDRGYLTRKSNDDNDKIDFKNSKTSLLSNLSRKSKTSIKIQETESKKVKKLSLKYIR